MVNGSEFLRLNGGESRGKKPCFAFYIFLVNCNPLGVCFWKKKLLHEVRTQKKLLRWIDRKGEREADRG